MKVIIAGSRTITDCDAVCAAVVASGFTITEVVSGGVKGVDRLGERWAEEHGVPVTRFLPDWGRHGRGGGLVRNKEMASTPTPPSSSGTVSVRAPSTWPTPCGHWKVGVRPRLQQG